METETDSQSNKSKSKGSMSNFELEEPDSFSDVNDESKILAKRVKTFLTLKIRQKLQDRTRFQSSPLGQNVRAVFANGLIKAVKSNNELEKYQLKPSKKSQIKEKGEISKKLCLKTITFPSEACSGTLKGANLTPSLRPNLANEDSNHLIACDYKLHSKKIRHHRAVSNTSGSHAALQRYQPSLNPNPWGSNDRLNFLSILNRANQSLSEIKPHPLLISVPQTSKNNCQYQRNFRIQEEDFMNISNQIKSPSLQCKINLKSITFKLPDKENGGLDKKDRRHTLHFNTSPRNKFLARGLTEKELTLKNVYFYHLRKSLVANHNYGILSAFIRKSFPEEQGAEPHPVHAFETKVLFYEIHERIEKTSLKKVVRGKQIITNTPVLLTIAKIHQRSQKLIEEMLYQIECTQKCLYNPYVVKSYESFKESDNLFLVSENCDIMDIDSCIKKNKFSMSRLKLFIFHLIYATRQIHEKGLIHGSINTKNVLVSKKGMPLLRNFSLKNNQQFEAYSASQKRTRMRTRKGMDFTQKEYIYSSLSEMKNDMAMISKARRVPVNSYQISAHVLSENLRYYQYRAPESGSFGRGQCTQKMDVWSIGVLLFYMAYKRLPFKGDSVKAIKEDILNHQIDFPRTGDASSMNLNELLKNMLKPTHIERPSLDEVMENCWFEDIKDKFEPIKSKMNRPEKSKIKNGLMMVLEEIGFPSSYIVQQINSSQPNHIRACLESSLNNL